MDFQNLIDAYETNVGDWVHEGWEMEECAAACIRRRNMADVISTPVLVAVCRMNARTRSSLREELRVPVAPNTNTKGA